MNIVIPMAGLGKRMRPHTLTVPKPLLPIAGKPIVQRLVEDIAKVCGTQIDEIAFVVGHFGEEAESNLLKIAESVGAKGKICYQEEALGTAHAILCGREVLKGNVIVAYADTLFKAGFNLNLENDASIWVQKVENPAAYGVIRQDAAGNIVEIVEKPQTFVSDLAIIGIYYFKDGENFCKELDYLIDNDIKVNGEYYITDALENMNNKGVVFSPAEVKEWLDCGNKDATVYTNQRYLEYLKDENLVDSSAQINNSVIIQPVFIGANVIIENSVIGPHVSVGPNTKINNSIIKNSIIQQNTKLSKANIGDSMIGNYVELNGNSVNLSVGDYNVITI
jgi:glucose-1-phosphate thymidylyltransferase